MKNWLFSANSCKGFIVSLKEDEITLSVDFLENCDNKQHHEIQSAHFGYEAFHIQLLVITDHMILMGHALIKVQA